MKLIHFGVPSYMKEIENRKQNFTSLKLLLLVFLFTVFGDMSNKTIKTL